MVGVAMSCRGGCVGGTGDMPMAAVSTAWYCPTICSTGSGSQPSPVPVPAAEIAASAVITWPGSGRCRGSLARHRAIIPRGGSGRLSSTGSACTMR
jgi:hypothetical protein